jgi:ligand-binding sensor domain-containing protein/signal transduction histidine kinase
MHFLLIYVRRKAILVLLLLPGFFPTAGQIRYESISIEQGLSQSSIWCILQDSRGFMWIGTADGLNRFDGYTFKVYRHNARDVSSLRDNTVWTLLEDHEKKIWVGTAAGLHLFDPRTETFTFLPDDSSYYSTHLRTFIYSIVEDRDSNLWIGSVGGLSVLNLKTGSIKEYQTSDFGYSGEEQGVRVNMMDDAGDIWISCTQHVYRFQRATGTFVEVGKPDAVHARSVTIYQDSKGTVWLAPFDGGLYALDKTDHSYRHWNHDPRNANSLSSNLISRAFSEDDQGRIWIGTASAGLNIFDPEKNMFTRILTELDKTNNTFYDKVSSVYRDRSGIMWIGYDGSGIVKIDPRPNKFRHVLLPPARKDISGNNFFKSLMVDRQDRVWLGTYNQGVAILDRHSGKVQRLTHNPSDPNSLSSNSVFALLEDQSGTVWIGTLKGLDVYTHGSKQVRHSVLSGVHPDDVRGNRITSLGLDSSGTVWVGTAKSVFRFDRQQERAVPVLHVGDIDSLRPFAGSLCFAADKQTFWCGTSGAGLLKLTLDGTLVKRYSSNRADGNSISHNAVKTLCIDSDGMLWIGTEDGLNRFDPENETWRAYRSSDGLPNDFIYGVLMDKHRNLWISTNRGLSRMTTADPARPQFRNYTVRDGLQSSEFNTNTYFQTPQGEMFFGGVNGFNSFFPDSVKDNPVLPRAVLTRFKKFDQPAELDEDIAVAKEVRLSYSESVFSLEFAALEFTDPKENLYAYKLEGFDKEWVQSGKRREARYTNLDPGTYTFRVKASNNDGIWNDEPASITITIVPPFWRTGWFIGLMVVLGASTFGGTIRFISTQKLKKRIEQLEREKAVQDERLRTRERIARDLHDDLASTVGSAGFFIESVKNQMKDATSQAREFLDKTSSLLTEAEESMSDIVWSVSPKHDTLESLLARMRLTAADLCRPREIRFETAFEHNVHAMTLAEEIRRNVYLIFKEALTNAVRHSGAALIKMTFAVEEGRFEMTIEDDGKGMPVTDPPSTPAKRGHGVRNMMKRAEEIKAALSIENGSPQGTVVRLRGIMTQVSH